jgi:ribosomal protein S18 acetylase RimI-like enzyme
VAGEPTGKAKVSLVFPEHYQQTAAALGRTFINDPPMLKILGNLPDPAQRAQRLTKMFEVALRVQRRNGLPVFGVMHGGKVAGAAVTGGTSAPSVNAMVLGGLADLPKVISAVGAGGTVRALRLLDAVGRNHPHEPHLYLNMLGVDPGYQRRHYGIALLDHLRDLAAERDDVAGVYLETATEANVAYYSRAGYEVLGELKPLGVRIWRMMQWKRRT